MPWSCSGAEGRMDEVEAEWPHWRPDGATGMTGGVSFPAPASTPSASARLRQLADAARLVVHADVAVVSARTLAGGGYALAASVDGSAFAVQHWSLQALTTVPPTGHEPTLIDLADPAGTDPVGAAPFRALGLRAVLRCPVVRDGDLVGWLDLGWLAAVPSPTDAEYATLRTLTALLSQALVDAIHEPADESLRGAADDPPLSVLAAGLRRLGATLREVLQADIGIVYVPSGRPGQLVGAVVDGSAPGAEALVELPLHSDAPLVQEWKKASASLVDLAGLIRAFGRHALLLQLQSGLVAPLWSNGQTALLGLVLLLRVVPRTFPDEERVRLERLLGALAPMLTLAWQLEQVDRARALHEALLRLAALLTEAKTVAEIGRAVAESLRDELAAGAALLGIVAEDGQSVSWYGAVGERLLGPVTTVVDGDSVSEAVQSQRVVRGERGPIHLPPELTALGLTSVPETLVVPAVQREQLVVLLVQRPGTAFSGDEEWFVQGVAAWAARAVRQQDMMQTMQQAGDARASLLAQLLAYQEEERKRLVDVIHNQTLQGLATCLYRIELTIRQAEEQSLGGAALQLRQVRDLLAEQIASLREAVFQLRPVTLDHLGLEAALREYVARLHEHGIEGTIDLQLSERLDSTLETAIYRVVQETIERVRQPAGIHRVIVRVREGLGEKIIVTVADDGPAVAASDEHALSLVALRERVALLGGVLRVSSVAQAGTVIQLVLPSRRAAPGGGSPRT